MVDQIIDMELVVTVFQKGVKVRVHKQVGDLFLCVQDIKTGNNIMRVPAVRLNNLPALMKAIEQQLITNPVEGVEVPVKTT